MKRIRSAYVLVFLAALALLSPAILGAQSGPLTKPIRMGYLPGLYQHIGFVAMEKKFFEAEGLTAAEYRLFNTGPQLAEALAARAVDVGLGMGAVPGLAAKGNGVPLVLLATTNWGNEAIMLRADLAEKVSVKNPASIKGLRIAFPARSTQPDFIVRLWVERLGLDPNRDVRWMQIQPGTSQEAALTRKDIDIVATWEPNPAILKKRGLAVILETGEGLIPHHDNNTVVVMKDWLAANRDQAIAVVRALERARRFASENPEEFYQITAKWTRVDLDDVKDGFQNKRLAVPTTLAPNEEFLTLATKKYLAPWKYIQDDPDVVLKEYLTAWRGILEAAGIKY